ncbi:MAG: hypothetical protein IJU70_00985 [Lentisphaeria bacterium]|nr:hypothetical protein [Lentisphaeria bacterium]
MRKFCLLLMIGAIRSFAAGTVFFWPCDDGGTPPATVRCAGQPRFNGRISPAKKAAFLKKEGKTALRLDGSSVVIPHSPELDMTGGFVLSFRCAPDFSAVKNWKWMGIISKGKNYSSGYAVMFNPAGAILFTLKTDQGLLWFQTGGGVIRPGVEQTVTVSARDGTAEIYVDEKPVASRKYKGKLQDAGHPLCIGSGYYGYFGTVRDVKLGEAGKAAVPQKCEPAAVGKRHEWKFDDGTGSALVRCSSTAMLDGKIRSIGRSRWAQADERGFFLRLDGASVEIPFQESIDYPEGFILEAEFAVDFKAAPRSKWFGLLSTGKNYSSGYAVLIRPDGALLLTLLSDKGNLWFQTGAGVIGNNRDCRLQIFAGDGTARIFVDGKLISKRSYRGKLIGKGQPLFVGTTYYPFHGNVYNLKILPYDKALVPAEKTVSEPPKAVFKPQPVVDPPGTVIVADFGTFCPAPETGAGRDPRCWCFGRTFKTGPLGTLYPPQIDAGTISWRSGLKGKYDFYLCGRLLSGPTRLQLAIGDDPQAYFVDGAAQAEFNAVHRNYEVCIARDLEMDDLKITFYPGTFYYLGYLKFIPAANRRAKENTPDPDVSVTRGAVEKVSPARAVAANAHLFTERRYVDDRPAPVVSEISRKRGFQIFSHPWMRLLFTNSCASADTGKAELKIAASPGEYEPATLGIRALRDAGRVSLRQSRPFGSSGISAEIAVAESIPKRSTSYHGRSEYMTAPQYLEKTDAVELKKEIARQFWITFHVPRGTPAGRYRGEFELVSLSGIVKIPAEVEVYPFELEHPGMSYGMWVQEFNERMVREDFEAMGRHGMNWVCMHSDKAVKFDDMRLDSMKMDLDRSLFSVAAETLQKHSPVTMITLYDGVLREVIGANRGREIEALKKVREITGEYCRKRNFPEIHWLGDDEVLSHPRRIDDCIARLKMYKKAGLRVGMNHLWKKTVRPQQEAAAKLAALSDMFIIRYNTGTLYYVDTWPEILAACLAEGKTLLSYNNDSCLTMAQPAGKRFAHGWFLRSIGKGSSGMGWYMYLGISGSPYTDLDGSSDWCYTYPPAEGRKGGPSIDFEALREGIDDMRYIRTLEKTVAEAKKRNIDTSEAEGLLTALANSVDRARFLKNSLFINSVWDRSYEKDGRRFASGDYLPPIGWSVEDFDQARAKIAAMIMKLHKEIGR